MASKAAKKHWVKRAKNNREAAKHASGSAKEARLMIAHGYDKLAKSGGSGGGRRRRKR